MSQSEVFGGVYWEKWTNLALGSRKSLRLASKLQELHEKPQKSWLGGFFKLWGSYVSRLIHKQKVAKHAYVYFLERYKENM